MSVTKHASDKSDGGFTLVLTALLLVIMMIFTAIVVDVGAVYNERRQDQNAADSAALAAARELGGSDATLVSIAEEYAEDTLGVNLSTAEWNSCDGDAGVLAFVIATANCISHDGSRVRVRIPDQFHQTTFGRVVGLNEIRHGAFAIAGLQPAGFGGVLPFFALSSVADQGYGCLTADGPSECDNYTGSFGGLNFSEYFPCYVPNGNSDKEALLESNAAAGIDHTLSRYLFAPHNAALVQSNDPTCPSLPNSTGTLQGNSTKDNSTRGLLTGSNYRDGDDARLRRSSPSLALPRIDAFGVNLDNTPLWWFIPENYGPGEATSADIPASCKRDQFVNSSGNLYADPADNSDLPAAVVQHLTANDDTEQQDQILALLIRCFRHYVGEEWTGEPLGPFTNDEGKCRPGGCQGVVFGKNSSQADQPDLYDIQYTPRFGYAPEAESKLGSGNSIVPFERFRAVYLHRFILGNDVTTWDPYTEPEPPNVSPGPNAQAPVLAFFFPDSMLPGGLGGPTAPLDPGVNRFITLLR